MGAASPSLDESVRPRTEFDVAGAFHPQRTMPDDALA
jgi:hypothetical protein